MFGAFQVGPFQTDFQQQTVTVSQDAGRSRRRRYLVEIDGQAFWVRNEEEARRLLAQARVVAEQAAQISVLRAQAAPVTVKTPRIRGARELAPVIAEARKDIEKIFERARVDYELYHLLNERIRQEEDEEALLLL